MGHTDKVSIVQLLDANKNVTHTRESHRKWKVSRICSVKILVIGFVILTVVELYKIFVQVYYCKDGRNLEHVIQQSQANDHPVTPRIVFWTKFFASNEYGSIGLVNNSTFTKCPSSCGEVVFANGEPVKLRDNDAVVFHARDLNVSTLPTAQRHADQVWVFLMQESPEHTEAKLEHYNNIFNWTMTYRQDSEIYHPYGLVKPNLIRNSSVQPTAANVANKTKLAAIIVAHCRVPSNRESFINDLQHLIPIDVYGSCGNYTCPNDKMQSCPDLSCKYEQFRLCTQRLSTTYKFYLSFENSLCVDYISEKFFNILQTNMIPVVYGGADYSLVAPPHSYINSRNFSSPEELAKYLMFLDSNDEEYLKYFEWKKNYYADVTEYEGWCDLCTKLKSNYERKVYESIKTWWYFPGEERTTVKSGYACEPKPNFAHKGWMDTRKNSMW